MMNWMMLRMMTILIIDGFIWKLFSQKPAKGKKEGEEKEEEKEEEEEEELF